MLEFLQILDFNSEAAVSKNVTFTRYNPIHVIF